MMAECVNLKEQFGDRFKVAYEESYQAERGDHCRAEDPWLMIMLCRHGEIYPFGGDQLVASTKVAGGIARVLKGLSYTIVYQDGSDGVDVLFPGDRFEEIAAIMKPRKRRQISDAEGKRLAEMGAKFRFMPGAQAPETAQISLPSTQDDSDVIDPAMAQMGLRNGDVLK